VAWTQNGLGIPPDPDRVFSPIRAPTIDAAAYSRPGPIARSLQELDGGRYLAVVPLLPQLGFLPLQRPEWWGALANQRGLLFGLEDVQGNNPVQPRRYWDFVRTVNPGIRYNLAFLGRPAPSVLDLLQVGWVIASSDRDPPYPGLVAVASEGTWVLYGVPDAAPRASAVASWRVVGSQDEARLAAVDPAFDPSAAAILEEDPGLGTPPGVGVPGPVLYRAAGSGSAVLEVSTPVPAVVVVRNPYDPNWQATVDGRPVRVLPADLLMQGIPVPPGDHRIILRYTDPLIGLGLLISALALAALVVAALILTRRRGGGRPPAAAPASRGRPEMAPVPGQVSLWEEAPAGSA
jgi:hypothetical protein